MAEATTTTAAGSVATIDTLTNLNKTWYEPMLLDRAIAEYFYCNLAQPSKVPAQEGGTIDWRKFVALTAATTPLVSGQTPASLAASVTNLQATPLQYGAYIRHSDLLQLQAIDNVTAEFAEMLGEQAGLTADTLCRDLMITGGTVQYADNVGARGSILATSILDGEEITRAWATLKNANARGWDFLNGRFAVVLNALAWEDLVNSSQFRNAAQEAKPRSDEHPFFTGDVFDYMRCRFFVTSQAPHVDDAGDTNVDAYITMVIARGAFGIGGIGDQWIRMELGMGGTGNPPMPVSLINKTLGSGGPEDPLNQRASIGWKGMQQEKELDATLSVRIEHACSSGDNT